MPAPKTMSRDRRPAAVVEDPKPRPAGAAAEPVGATRSPEDQQAVDLLLAFTRLIRERRSGGVLPERLAALLAEGTVAPRHLTTFALVNLEGPLSVSDLAERQGLALSTASLLVTQLADLGLLERREDEHDRRRTVVSVAPRYAEESEAVAGAKLAPLRRALARMGPTRARHFIEAIGVLADELARVDV